MNAASAIDYESIFLHAPVGMCMSENRIMRSCNEALASMFGYARAQLDDQVGAAEVGPARGRRRPGSRVQSSR